MKLSLTKISFACALALLARPLLLAAAPAAPTGTLTGSVLAPESGKFLFGAEVAVAGTALHTTTDRSGVFLLSNVPAGAQQLVVSYPGRTTGTVPITVAAGSLTRVPVSLGSEVFRLNTFTVESAREGMSAAIAQQRASANQKIVEASDQYGDISEGNAAEYLKFLPGVNIEYNANDARAVGLRGLPTYLTAITFNGNPLASASSANPNRRFEFEQVSLNDVATIEVNKTLTPDLPATNTAGSVNFVSKSAFDRQGALLTYRGYLTAADTDLYLSKQPGYSDSKVFKVQPSGVVDYSVPVSSKFGFDLNASESQIYNDYPRVVYAYQWNPAFGATPHDPYPLTWDTINEQKLTKRQQLEGTFDFRPNDSFKATVSAGWSWYWLVFEDRDYTFSIGNLAPLAAGATDPTYAGANSVTSLPGKGKISQEVSERWKTGTTYFIDVPLEQKVTPNLTISSVPYWTQSYSKYRDSQQGNVAEVDGTISGITTTLTNIGSLNPGRIATYDAAGLSRVDPLNLGGYTLSLLRLRPQTGYDTWSGVPVDVKYSFDSAFPLTLRAGYRYDDHVRQDSIFLNSLTSFANPANSTGAAVAALRDDVFSGHDVGYGIGGFNWLDPYKAHQAFPNSVIPALALSSDTYAIWNEYTNAPYIRADATLWDRFLIVAGLRYEKHVIHSLNRLPTGTAGLQGNASLVDERYYPSVNLKYNFTKNFDLRFGASKSLGLPDYNQLIPSAPTITDPNATNPVGTVSIYNPKIKAYTVYNYDLSAEYYFNPSGFLSASLYNKRFQNYLVTFTQAGTPALAAQYGVGPTSQPITSYNITSTVNIPDASGFYNGFELAYNQTLAFLPAPFNTTGLQINWSRVFIGGIRTRQTLSSASVFQNAVLQQDAYLALYKTAVTNEFNIALNTTYKRLNAFLTMNYTGASLLSTTQASVAYSGAPTNFYDLKAMTAPRALTDLRLEYQASSKITPYIQIHNLFNRPIINTVDGHVILRSQYGDPSYEIGIRGVW